MGTNYYVDTSASCGGKCAIHCHGEQIHLGLSAAGWAFQFQAYPDRDPPVTDYATWLKLLDLGQLRDEYGHHMGRNDFLRLIDAKRGGHKQLSRDDYYDADGNLFIKGWFS